jgi:ribonuclease HI
MFKKNTLSVDAAYSSKTGIMEYRGVWTDSGIVYFHEIFSVGTNNVGEFLAVTHALAKMKSEGLENDIYTDSNTAMSWVRRKRVNSGMLYNSSTKNLWSVISRAENWLKNNEYNNEILKWKTKEWGEVFADFDRK